MSERRCEVCGAPFYVSLGHVAQGWDKFCSIKCRTKAWVGESHPSWRGGLTKRTCLHCGKEFEVKPSHAKDGEGKYCSRQCHHLHKSISLICDHCGKAFRRPQCQVRGQETTYCSKECMLVAVAREDNCACEECGASFHRKPSDLTRSDKVGVGRFCSMRCKARHMSHTAQASGRARGRGGKREDLDGLYVRSSWEANYARYLNWLVDVGEIVSWEYEVDTYEFTAIKRGSRFYTPDFKILNPDGSIEYHEVKGYMDAASKTKLKRMAKYYPDVTLKLIDRDVYYSIARDVKALIPEWE